MNREFTKLTIFGVEEIPFTPEIRRLEEPVTVESWPHIYSRDEDGRLTQFNARITEDNRILICSTLDLRTFRAVQKQLWYGYGVCVGLMGRRGGGQGELVCPICERRFRSKIQWIMHINRVHLIDPSSARPCLDHYFEITARKAGEPATA